MLSSVTERIEKEQKALDKMKEKKKKKKDKKQKKHKKEKKRKRQSRSSDSESSEEEAKWVVKGAEQEAVKPISGPTLQRDRWMESPLVTDLIPTVTRAELREKQRGEEDRKKAEAASLLEQPGQHSRELNPYWKEGGKGLPENRTRSSTTSTTVGCGDGGLSWLCKAYQRCQQQAKDEGRSLEEVAAERYGSLEKLNSMIKEAEESSGLGRWQHNQGNQRSKGDGKLGDRSRSRSPLGRQSRRDQGRIDSHSDRDSWRGDDIGRDHQRDSGNSQISRERGVAERSDRDSRDSREKQSRDRDGDKLSRDIDRKRGSGQSHIQNREQEGQLEGRRFVRPNRDSDDESTPSQKRGFMMPSAGDFQGFSSSVKRRFARPNDSDEDDNRKSVADSRCQTNTRRDHGRSSVGGWRRKPAAATSSQEGKEEKKDAGGRREGVDGWGDRRHRKQSSSASTSSETDSPSSSGSDSMGEDDGHGRDEEKTAGTTSATASANAVKILSEDEMNSLGARILRAELMGEEALAGQLKAQLEQAQKAKENTPKSQPKDTPKTLGTGAKRKEEEEEDNTVVLTRTGRDGMVRPLPEQEFHRDRGGKKRRKMKNVVTHSREGERTQYFDDDDRHDLKTLVQMEKLGTAEDQSAMFARLAGRSTEKTDDDFQVDDIFLSKAARQQSGARNEERERSKAIFEHKKISSAMEKCQFCFNKIPKHLLIAIGSKVYLCLPAHRSMTPGHCLIVPMQHVSAATALDEDIWTEIQTFRKQLVQMFASQEQDVVFMETSMHLRHFPHMVLECIPLEREVGDLAPIYFKKAIQDAGPEWSNNKKVVDLSRKDIRHSVPKGFPYFSVDFGLQGGFAHVIEDEKAFPLYFGREIVGGMIDADPGLWRKPHREGFEDQRQKVLQFEKWWKPYDFTSSA